MLHVDDEVEQLKFAKFFLEEADHAIHIDSISSASEALYKLRQQFYDCVISDYSMPGVNGIEFCRRTREILIIPFIMYTGTESEQVAAAAFATGADDYVRKEVDPSHYKVLANRTRLAVEKYRAMKDHQDSETKYEERTEISPQGVLEADEMGNLSHSNAKTVQSLGYSKEELEKGLNVVPIVIPEERRRLKRKTDGISRAKVKCDQI